MLHKPLFVTALSLTLISSFLSATADGQKEKIGIRGEIVHLVIEEKGKGPVLARLRIEGEREPDTHVDKAVMAVTAETKVYLTKSRNPADFTALKQGQKVEASFKGPVMESYPVQGTAAEIVILDGITE